MQAHFCGNCGSRIDGSAASDRPLAPPAARWGEIKQVTALSADIVGSTELIADLDRDPERAMSLLRPVVALMCDEVARFGGLVLSILGDGIFAVFGAPRAEEGHALLACEAALAIQQVLAHSHGGIRVRIGLHSGSVVADAAEGDDPAKQTVYGLTAHVANRLQALATPGTIVMSVDCYSLVQALSSARPLGRQALRGINQEFELFELAGLRPVATSQYFQRARLSRFRGRVQEMAFLQAHLDGRARHVNVVGIAGGPGTGKSRLCFEFAERCRAQRIPVYEVKTQPYGRAAPLQPVLEFLRSAFFRINRSPSPALARRKITRHLRALRDELGGDLPILFDFLGISDPAEAPYISPTVRHERLVAIIRILIAHFGRTRSVIIAEDLHWLDEASEAFLATLLERFVDSQILLILNYRPSYAAPWMRNDWFEERALLDLSHAEIEGLVEELAARQPALDHLRLRIAHRSGGNPFFAEELVQSLVELASVAKPEGLAATELPASTALPMTVQGAIAARLDNLSTPDRALLQVAAVMGQEIELPILEDVADMPALQLRQGLARLCRAEVLQGADPIWTFRHPLIQEVAYNTQLRARRERLHAAIARAMREHHHGQIGEKSALIAYHHEAASQTKEAAAQMEVAANWVGSKSPAQATQHWQKVRQLLQAHRDDPAARALLTRASMQIAWLGWREGMPAVVAKTYVDEAAHWAQEVDETLIPLLLFVDARIAGASGAADAYAARLRQAIGMLTPVQRGRAATLYAALSQAYGWSGLQKHALRASDAALARVAGLERFDYEFLGYSVEHWILGLRGRILGRLGRFDEAQACFARLASTADRSEDATVRFIVHLGHVDVAWFHDDGASALTHAAAIAALAEEQGSPYLRVFARQAAGTAKLLLRDPEAACADFTAGLSTLRSAQVANETEAELIAGLAQATFDDGRAAAAAVLAQEALAIARTRNARMPEIRACIVLALAAAAETKAAGRKRGATWLRRADRLIRQTGVVLYHREFSRACDLLQVDAGPEG